MVRKRLIILRKGIRYASPYAVPKKCDLLPPAKLSRCGVSLFVARQPPPLQKSYFVLFCLWHRHTLHIVCASLGIRPQSNLFVGLHLSMGETMRLSISLYDFQDCSDAPSIGLIGRKWANRTPVCGFGDRRSTTELTPHMGGCRSTWSRPTIVILCEVFRKRSHHLGATQPLVRAPGIEPRHTGSKPVAPTVTLYPYKRLRSVGTWYQVHMLYKSHIINPIIPIPIGASPIPKRMFTALLCVP